MSQTQTNLVEIRGVSFTRGSRRIFDNISLNVPRGKITAIMGPSGIGKTTLLRLSVVKFNPTAVKSCLTVKTSPPCLVRVYTMFVNA